MLFGDFLQLGPVFEPKLQNSKHKELRTWVVSDCFTHMGIRTPDDAARNESCVVLQHQFRFGANLRELANKVIYQVLRDADEFEGVRANPSTEIVVVDVSGLPDLAEVRTADGRRGWWSAGLVLSRALAEHHLGEGPVGVVTPYAMQRDFMLAALRDKGIIRNVDVGTVHAFQGREFPTVVFDLVEDGAGWVAKARGGGGTYEDNGVRLFGVAITRVQHRLYFIANYDVVRTAGRGPLAELRRLCVSGGGEVWSAAALLGLQEHHASAGGAAFAEVRDILRQLVTVTDISDELTFWAELEKHLRAARRRVWMWSPWIATRADQVIPLVGEAVARGVDVRIFIRPDDDRNMRRDWAQKRIPSLKETGATVIRADHEHRKIVVMDEETVLFGSINTLSQSPRKRTSEIMITMVGRAFATRLLDDLHADEFGVPKSVRHVTSSA